MPMVVAFGGSSRVSALSFAGACNWLRIEARIADGVECQRVGAFLCVDLQRPRAQLKTQRADPIQRLQRLTNLRLLGATVHRRNAKHPALATLGVCRSGHGLWIETALRMASSAGQGAILRIDLQRARAELETQRADSRGSRARRISDSSALQSMVAIRNSLPWPGLLVAAGTTAAVLEQPEEQQGSTVVGECWFLIS